MLVIGGVIGVVAALLLGKAAQSLLFGLEGNDPWVVASVSVVLAVIALAAGYLPAHAGVPGGSHAGVEVRIGLSAMRRRSAARVVIGSPE